MIVVLLGGARHTLLELACEFEQRFYDDGAKIVLTPEVREFLKTPLIARLSVIGADGYPHTVPLWFDVDDDDLIIISDRKTRKVDYLVNNPKANLCIGGGEVAEGQIGTGYMFKGDITVEADPDYKWLKQVTHRYEVPEAAEKDIETWRTTLDMIILRLKVVKVTKVY